MKILIIAKYYPPINNARSIQLSNLCKALTQEGVDIRLITTSTPLLLKEEPQKDDFITYRIDDYSSDVIEKKTVLSRAIKMFAFEFRSAFGSAWSKKAANKAIEVNSIFKADLLLTVSEPFESHLVAKHILNSVPFLKWAVFLSDPKPKSILPHPYCQRSVPILSYIQKRVVRQILNRSDICFFSNNQAPVFMETKLNIKIQNKSHILPHTVNFSSNIIQKHLVSDGCLVHLGDLTRERVSESFVKALKEAFTVDKLHGLKLVGYVCPEFRALVSKYDISDNVIYLGKVSNDQAIKIAHESEYLLLLEANLNDNPFIPSKLSEYCYINKPILALTNMNSTVSSIFNQYKIGVTIYHEDSFTIMNAKMCGFFNQEVNNYNFKDSQEYFSSKRVARHFIGKINDLLGYS